jgi:hypothetical protein
MSDARFHHLLQGPFPGLVDPFAEAAHYFQQIHSGMIYELQRTLQRDLYDLGYVTGKEASLQIIARRKPDIFVRDRKTDRKSTTDFDYDAAAVAAQITPPTLILDAKPEEDALYIYEADSGELVTVVEIISPRNKSHPQEMAVYRIQREQVFLSQGINVVEIDPTRSTNRLIDSPTLQDFPYHVAVHLPGDPPRAYTSHFDEPLKPFALPLRGEVIRVEPQAAYDTAYQSGNIAWLLESDGVYENGTLQNPATLTDTQVTEALDAVQAWRDKLATL